jgi:galactokinase
MDFENPANPVIEKIDFDLEKEGYNLCITDTKGSHADLTDDYAAVPREMKDAAKCFGKDVLREVSEEDFIKDINTVRKTCGDRAALRGLHFFEESKRAKAEADALKCGDFGAFLKTFKASGDSSFKYLQNVYTDHDSRHQNVSVALAVSEIVLGDEGLSRVHGGGFAGTIQAFVKESKTEEYINAMNNLFGEGSCKKFQIRSVGGTKVMD